jgi:hypothetical protein
VADLFGNGSPGVAEQMMLTLSFSDMRRTHSRT